MIEVYSHRKNAAMAEALVRQLRAEGRTARNHNTRYFDPKQIEKEVSLVYHDGTEPLVPWIYGRAGIQCEPLPGIVAGHGGPDPDSAFYLVQDGHKFRLMGPDGPVGKPQTTEEEAWAQGAPKGEDAEPEEAVA